MSSKVGPWGRIPARESFQKRYSWQKHKREAPVLCDLSFQCQIRDACVGLTLGCGDAGRVPKRGYRGAGAFAKRTISRKGLVQLFFSGFSFNELEIVLGAEST